MQIQSISRVYSKLFLIIYSIFFTQIIAAQQEYLIRFEPNTDIQIIEEVFSGLSAEKTKPFNIEENGLMIEIYYIQRINSVIELDNITLEGKEEILAYYNQHPSIKYMEEDHNDYELVFTPPTNFDDPWLSDQWHLEKIRAIEAFGALSNYNSVQTVEVAVLDTGVDYHEDIDGNFSPSQAVNLMNYNADVDDDIGHSTHIMGILAALSNNNRGIVGFPNIKVLPVKIFDFNGAGELRTNTSAIMDGILHAINRGVPIINCSFGGGSYSQALHDVLSYAETKGHLIVAAAGNYSENTDTKPFYPASYQHQNIIAVGASNSNDKRASISNFGAESVDIFAPGEQILSTFPGNDYCRKSGTSMAAPVVGAVAAMIMGICEDMPPAIVKEIIVSSADQVTDLNGQCVANGRLDALAALQAAECSFYAYFQTSNYNPCLGDVVTFEAQALPDIVNAFWMIDGIPTASNTLSLNSAFDTEGTHTISLTVQNTGGELDTYEAIINVKPSLANASFTLNQQGNVLEFIPTIQNPDYGYFWSFDDGVSSELVQPFHAFQKGDYAVSLIVSNGCGSQMVEKKIEVTTNMVSCSNSPSFTVSPSNICVGDGILLDNTSSSSFSHFEWIVNDRLLATAPANNPDFNFTPNEDAEILEITLVGYNEATGCVSSLSQVVSIDQDAVFPGDINLDNIVNQEDLQFLEVAMGTSGSPRTHPNPTEFRPQCSQDWALSFPNGINYKHADADGSGEINELDKAVVCANFGMTNADNLITPYQESASAELEIQASAVYHPNTEKITVTYELIPLNGSSNINLESLSFESSLEELMGSIESVDLENTISEADEAFYGCDGVPIVSNVAVVIGNIGPLSEIEEGVLIQFFGNTTGVITDVLAGDEEESFCVSIPISNVIGLDEEGNPIAIRVNTQVEVEVKDEVCNTSFHTAFSTSKNQSLHVFETIQLADEGFLTAANQNNDIALLIKSDAEGNEEWRRSFDSGEIENVYTMAATKDGGVLVLGVQEGEQGSSQIYLMKLDELGNLVNAQKIKNGATNSRGYKINAFEDGRYGIAGFSQQDEDFRALLLIMVDADGTILESYEMGKSNIAVEWIELEDGYALVGEAFNYKTASRNLLFMRLSEDMKTESVKWFVAPDNHTHLSGYSIKSTSDGGYFILAQSEDKVIGVASRQVFAMKLDKKEQIEWARTLEADGLQFALSVVVNEDETYTIAGGTLGKLPSLSNHYIFQLTKKGYIIPEKSVRLGVSGETSGAFVHECKDGSWVAANVKWKDDISMNSEVELWKSEDESPTSFCEAEKVDILQQDLTRKIQVYSRRGTLKEVELVAKELQTSITEYQAHTVVHCRKSCKSLNTTLTASKGELSPSIERVISLQNLYPNPIQAMLSIEVFNASSTQEKAQIEVFDYIGNVKMAKEILLQSHHNKLTINTSDLPSGVYILKVKSNEQVISRKFIKQ